MKPKKYLSIKPPGLSEVCNPKSLKQLGLIIEIIEYTTPSSNHRVSFDEQELMGWWRCTRLHSLRQASDVWRRQQRSLAPELLSIIHSVFQASSVAAARRCGGGDAHCHEKTTISKCPSSICILVYKQFYIYQIIKFLFSISKDETHYSIDFKATLYSKQHFESAPLSEE